MKEAVKKYTQCVNSYAPRVKSLPDNYVFDENKSVKWNKEQVKIHNEDCERRLEEWKVEHRKLYKAAVDGLIKAIQEEATYNMTKEEATVIWEWQSCTGNFDNLERELLDLIELAERLYSAREKATSTEKQDEEKAVSEKQLLARMRKEQICY